MKIIEKSVDIYQYPTELEENSHSITIGDLHGNVVKLAQFLLRHGVIQFKSGIDPIAGYNVLVHIYETFGELAKLHLQRPYIREALTELVQQFNDFMCQLEIKNKILVRLIGDEVADRGSCDYFTLRLIRFLHENDVKVTILISNHNSEFIAAYEHLFITNELRSLNFIINEQKYSFFGLKLLLDEEVISETEVKELVQIAYKPTLKILDYTLTADSIGIFSHAPTRFDVIKSLADYFGVVYEEANKEALAGTIDNINHSFKLAVKDNKVHEFFNIPWNIIVENLSAAEIAQWPLIYVTWNRWDAAKETQDARPAELHDYHIWYVHGHDNYKSQLPHVHNLDTYCGKEERKSERKRIKEAAQLLTTLPENSTLRSSVQNYLDEVHRYRVLITDES
ncbi:Dot/Icm secretion system substrate [Legionella lansingensis]|uniref:Substrate of the Dot/Icm secretion system n=1 Tax=Legionella lansingensis TaxID=45067 RepID=A0A0W0VU49_9GAMM|nr:Dot/Icm T4SS effector Wip [Legionella lansingensis]KTD23485.1 substrate of the Dot/Icm secretion system [Legionella lansingensis]SNV50767.1 Dot/Icm secretion system substrate [Legionella lansingensis]